MGLCIESEHHDAGGDNQYVGEVRGKGLFIGMEFVDAEGRPEEAGSIVKDIQTRCHQNGALVWKAGQYGNVRLLPALVMTEEQADIGLDIIADAIDAATQAAD